MGFIIELILFIYGASWVYNKFIKDKDSELSKGINNFINTIKEEFNSPNKNISKNTTERIYDNEKIKKNKDSYQDALRLYKAGVITKKELKEFKK